ncbi:MAG: hypothetical protein KF708_24730 [Pirellulales bacterium]|nr:hypothetical protein [Pirellulales bacterium]
MTAATLEQFRDSIANLLPRHLKGPQSAQNNGQRGLENDAPSARVEIGEQDARMDREIA